MITRQDLDEFRVSGNWLSEGLKMFILEHIPPDETLTGEQVFERLRTAGEQFSLDFSDKTEITVRHLASGVTVAIWVDQITRVAGAWYLGTVSTEGVVYQSRWLLEQRRYNQGSSTEILWKIGETLGAQVTAPLPERMIQMPLPPWYHHGQILGTTHCRSGSTLVFVSEAQTLLDALVKETQELFQ